MCDPRQELRIAAEKCKPRSFVETAFYAKHAWRVKQFESTIVAS